jgi:hypothetical protein
MEQHASSKQKAYHVRVKLRATHQVDDGTHAVGNEDLIFINHGHKVFNQS